MNEILVNSRRESQVSDITEMTVASEEAEEIYQISCIEEQFRQMQDASGYTRFENPSNPNIIKNFTFHSCNNVNVSDNLTQDSSSERSMNFLS